MPDAAPGTHARNEFLRGFAGIEAGLAFGGDALERRREVWLFQHRAESRRGTVGEEDAGGLGIGVHRLRAKAGHHLVVRGDLEAVARVTDRRRERGRQRQGAVMRAEMREPGRQAGYAGSERAVHRTARGNVAFVVQIQVAMRGTGCDFARVDHHVEGVCGPMQQEEAAAANAGRIRFHDRERGRDGNRGVERVAAGIEYFLARGGGERMRGGHRRGRRRRRQLAGEQRRADAQRRPQQQARRRATLRVHAPAPQRGGDT